MLEWHFWPPNDTSLQKEHLEIAAICMVSSRMLVFQLKFYIILELRQNTKEQCKKWLFFTFLISFSYHRFLIFLSLLE